MIFIKKEFPKKISRESISFLKSRQTKMESVGEIFWDMETPLLKFKKKYEFTIFVRADCYAKSDFLKNRLVLGASKFLNCYGGHKKGP